MLRVIRYIWEHRDFIFNTAKIELGLCEGASVCILGVQFMLVRRPTCAIFALSYAFVPYVVFIGVRAPMVPFVGAYYTDNP